MITVKQRKKHTATSLYGDNDDEQNQKCKKNIII